MIVYDRYGKRTTLPHLDQATLTGHGMSLPAEVGALHNTWTRLRGEGWAPEPEVVEKIAARSRYAMPSWQLGFVWSIAAILFGTVLAIIGLAASDGNPPPFLLSPVIILILPLVTFAGVTTASVVARRHCR